MLSVGRRPQGRTRAVTGWVRLCLFQVLAGIWRAMILRGAIDFFILLCRMVMFLVRLAG